MRRARVWHGETHGENASFHRTCSPKNQSCRPTHTPVPTVESYTKFSAQNGAIAVRHAGQSYVSTWSDMSASMLITTCLAAGVVKPLERRFLEVDSTRLSAVESIG